MSTPPLTCILHVDAHIQEPVRPFDSNTWQVIQGVAKYRLEKHSSSKYTTVCKYLRQLEAIDDLHGCHITCYRKFTAIPRENEKQNCKTITLRSKNPCVTATSSGIFENVCIFCRSTTKRNGKERERLGQCESHEAASNIKTAANILSDDELLTHIHDIDFISKEVKYHHSCRRLYLKKADTKSRSAEKTVGDSASSTHNRHDEAFRSVSTLIEEHVIEQKGAIYLTSLHQKYITLLGSEKIYTAQKVEEKLLVKYANYIKSTKLSNKKGKVIHAPHLSVEDATLYAEAYEKSTTAKLVDAALILRQQLLNQKDNAGDLELPLTNAIRKGNGNPPEDLITFFRTLFTGLSTKSVEGRCKAERHVQSVSNDVLYIVTNGVIKPAKHLTLAMGLKSITGSRKVVEILNHFGHCVGYHMVEMIETEVAETIQQSSSSLPDGLLRQAGLHTGTAWDNYDENTETLSGAGTLHDTFGICYQDIPNVRFGPEACESVGSLKPGKGKRSFQGKQHDIAPYRKKPRIQHFEYEVAEDVAPDNFDTLSKLDMLWMMGFTWNQQTPLWIGWNGRVSEDLLPQQRIGYMKNLTQPPTQLNVVAQTLRLSQDVAQECGEEISLVTYDLAVAKLALKIQAQESPTFDNLFICFGSFHICLAYFACLGYLLDASGGPYLLTESGILASGSLNGFLSGRHYNRCKRIHLVLSLAFWKLHFRSFCDNCPDYITDDLNELIQELGVHPTSESVQTAFENEDLCRMIQAYEAYSNETRNGNHGKTGQFWMKYIDLVNLYLMFSRAYRTCDLDLYVHCLGQMCPIFFAMNRPNYSRWMTLYHLKLLNIDHTHPGGRQMLENGGLGIKRSAQAFSRVPVDMALEQTVNADAASRKTGITAFACSESALSRWMITRSVRTKVVSNLLEMADIKSTDEISHDQRSSRVRRDQEDVTKLEKAIENSLNPFGDSCDKSQLFCISSGNPVPEDIACDLLSVQAKGQAWYQEFKDGCFTEADRFEKPIPRRKVKNFASAGIKSGLSTKDKVVKELRCTTDLFGRLLYLATTSKLDLEKVLSYPLTPVPLCLGHIDGSLNKTDKSKLLSCLEKKIDQNPEAIIPDVCVVDGMYFIQSQTHLPPTYGDIANIFLERLCQMANRVDFVCDTYKSPSIKDSERGLRGKSELNRNISGPLQTRPKDFSQALRSPSFKTSLLRFLADEWSKDKYTSTLKGHDLYVAIDGLCFQFSSKAGAVERSVVPQLQSWHEEADTRIIYHTVTIAAELQSPTISVRASDTDVLVLLLHHIHRMGDAHIVMDIGSSSNNTRRYIDVTSVANAIGSKICQALPAFHAFTGCDYTAAFARKGKCRPFQILEQSVPFTEAFASLGTLEEPTEDMVSRIEHFVCTMYGKDAVHDVNKARYSIFKDRYAPKAKCSLDKIKGCDPSAFPPSKDVLLRKLSRVNYVSALWKNAHISNPVSSSPEDHGWSLIHERYVVKWFSGNQMPNFAGSQITQAEIGEDDDSDVTDVGSDSDSSADESD